MVKQAPTLPRILVMVGFALSCFVLLLFLWLSFGGPTPLQPKGYRFKIAFPEAVQLAVEADVKVSGVDIGKVRRKDLSPDGNATLATVELERKYAPIAQDARAVLRQKGLLGETYVELVTGSADGPKIPENGLLDTRNVQQTVELDEILTSLDPFTRTAFRVWQQDLGDAVDGRGQDLNDALGSLPGFVKSGDDLFEVLNDQRGALTSLVRNTGVVFEALSEREGQLAALIRNSDTVFGAIQREREDFAETFRVFPTFLDESKATFRRLQRFSRTTQPLVRDLRPALDDLGPTLDDVGKFAPDLERLFENFEPFIEASKKSLPATREILTELRPLLREVGPTLGELNPLLDWLSQHAQTLTDLFGNLGVATNAKTISRDPKATGHYLRQYGPAGAETVAVHPTRLGTNRGNAYFNPLSLLGPQLAASNILQSFDCKNAGGTPPSGDKPSTDPSPANPSAGAGSPACRTQAPYTFQGKSQRFPRVEREDYSGPTPRPAGR